MYFPSQYSTCTNTESRSWNGEVVIIEAFEQRRGDIDRQSLYSLTSLRENLIELKYRCMQEIQYSRNRAALQVPTRSKSLSGML
jgi:hypothetical protein